MQCPRGGDSPPRARAALGTHYWRLPSVSSAWPTLFCEVAALFDMNCIFRLSAVSLTMFEVSQFAEAYGNGGNASGGPAQVAAPAQPSEGMRVLLSTFENLNTGADKISAMSHAITSSGADPTPGQLMQVTMEAHKFLFKAELTSNVANRTSDGVQQLFKQQS